MTEGEAVKIIGEFLKNMAGQDNRCTAAPYFYVIRTKVKRPTSSGCGDWIEYYDPEDPECTFESYEDYVEKQKEWSEYNEMIEDDKEDFDLKMEKMKYSLGSIEYVNDWAEKGMFLTETDAKRHLEANHYHYSPDAHTYVKHAWRAPELKEFFQALYKYFSLEKGNLDL